VSGRAIAREKTRAMLSSPTRRRLSMDKLSLFGLFAVTAMLVCYALENRSAWFILAFAGACALGSAYGFLQGAWPFGLVEAVWALVAVNRWRSKAFATRSKASPNQFDDESRDC
jgi:hypothetical protein